jgi:hypothetical protein
MPRPKFVPISKKNAQTFYLYAADQAEDGPPEVSAQEWAEDAELAAELGLTRRELKPPRSALLA